MFIHSDKYKNKKEDTRLTKRFETFTLNELKDILNSKGLSVTGSKKVLIERIKKLDVTISMTGEIIKSKNILNKEEDKYKVKENKNESSTSIFYDKYLDGIHDTDKVNEVSLTDNFKEMLEKT